MPDNLRNGVGGIACARSSVAASDPSTRSRVADRRPTGSEADRRETVFIDPAVVDVGTIVGHLRRGVEAVVLDGTRSATQQIATALANRPTRHIVHVIAHGAPGRVGLSGGTWTSQTLADEAQDLARIGRAIGAGGCLRLWSCFTGAGPEGLAASVLAALAEADSRSPTGPRSRPDSHRTESSSNPLQFPIVRPTSCAGATRLSRRPIRTG